MDTKRLAWLFPVFVVATLAGAWWLARSIEHAPHAAAHAATAGEFSAARALAHLNQLLAEGVPHPAGSDANQVVAARISAILAEQGYTPSIQEGMKCSIKFGSCSTVRNIIAVKPGRVPGQSVLVVAHYDSVPAGPGAGDDGAGVAALLELARLLTQREPLLHDTIFLFSDAEEPGLFGAQLFAEDHPLMKTVGLAINLEGRGVTGPSMMFETSNRNARLVSTFSSVVRNPVTTSLLFELYKRLPNDTDLSIFKRSGVRSFNFAYARGTALYHSARDDLAHLSQDSLQHQGESALALLLRCAETPFEQLDAAGDATYFDLKGRWLVRWPSAANLIASLLLLAVILTAGLTARRSMSARALGISAASVLAVVVLMGGFGWLLSFPLGVWPDVSSYEHPSPWGGRLALLGAALLAVLVVARWLAARAGFVPTLLLIWLTLSVVAVLMAVIVPGATYLFLVPLAAFFLGGALALMARRPLADALLSAGVVGFMAAAYIALYHFLALDMMFSFRVAPLMALPLLLLGWSLLPLATLWLQDRGKRAGISGWALLAATSCAAIIGFFAQGYTAERPRGVNIVYEQDAGTGSALWRIESPGNAGSDFLQAANFGAKQDVVRYGLQRGKEHVKSATSLGMAAPALRISSDTTVSGQRRISGVLGAQRDGFLLIVGFPEGSPLLAMSVSGQPVVAGKRVTGVRSVRLYGFGRNVIPFEMVVEAGRPLPVVLVDVSALPKSEEGTAIAAARPGNAAAWQQGDRAMVHERVTL
jgi:hypothetical protein